MSSEDSPAAAQATELKLRGNEAHHAGNYEEAVRLYTQAAKLDPNNHVYFSNRSASYLKMGDPVKAEEDALRIVEMAPSWPKGYVRWTAALIKQNRPEDAQRAVETGLELAPDHSALLVLQIRAANAAGLAKLRGRWHGQTSEEMGGYVQEFDFKDDFKVSLHVLMNEMDCEYVYDTTEVFSKKGFAHLDVSQDDRPNAPPIKQILEWIDDDTFRVCSPYLTAGHPTTFENNPTEVVMYRGEYERPADEVEKRRATLALPFGERCLRFINEVIDKVPKMDVTTSESDTRESFAVKMRAQVKFQTDFAEARMMFGEDVEEKIKTWAGPHGEADEETLTEELESKIEDYKVALVRAGVVPPSVLSEEERRKVESALKKEEECAAAATRVEPTGGKIVVEGASKKVEEASSWTQDPKIIAAAIAAVVVVAAAASAVFALSSRRSSK